MSNFLVAAGLRIPPLPAGLWAVLSAVILAAGVFAAAIIARTARDGGTNGVGPGNGGTRLLLPGSFHDIAHLAGRAVSSDFAAALFLRRVADIASLAVASHAGISLAAARSLVAAGKWQADPQIRERLQLGRRQHRFESLNEVETFVALLEKAIAGYRNEQKTEAGNGRN